jgi:cupin fold WbuC family metalloprotein
MNTLPFQKISDEVFIATDAIVRMDNQAVEFIKAKALASPRGRARICAHKNASDKLHEMIIALRADSYVRPHRHHDKIESFHLVEGRADIVIFNTDGSILDVIKLGKDNFFYYRLDTPHYHTLVIHSPLLVIHEITNGPFDVRAADFAIFSPADHDKVQASEYMLSVKKCVMDYETNRVRTSLTA